MIGCATANIVSVGIRATKCNICLRANSKDVRVKPHICPINHIGSSGRMEAKLALYLTVEIIQNQRGRCSYNLLLMTMILQ